MFLHLVVDWLDRLRGPVTSEASFRPPFGLAHLVADSRSPQVRKAESVETTSPRQGLRIGTLHRRENSGAATL